MIRPATVAAVALGMCVYAVALGWLNGRAASSSYAERRNVIAECEERGGVAWERVSAAHQQAEPTILCAGGSNRMARTK